MSRYLYPFFQNLVEEPSFLRKPYPHRLVASFIGALDNLTSQSKAKMENLFLDINTLVKIRLGSILGKLIQRHNQREQIRRFDMNQDDCENKKSASTHFLQIQKTQVIELHEYFEQHCNVIPVFGFNCAKDDLNLFKTFFLPIPVNERDFELTVIKKANQFISFKFGDIMNFLDGATSVVSFLKA